jgi:hypothetical protein
MAQWGARPSIPFRRHQDFARERLIRRRSRAQAPTPRIGYSKKRAGAGLSGKIERIQTPVAKNFAELS